MARPKLGRNSTQSAERQRQILHLLRQDGRVMVTDLCERLQVSVATIRRDLAALEAEGFLNRTYGGGYLAASSVTDRPVTERHSVQAAAKAAIGLAAGRLIHAGETVVFDSGSTSLAIARQLPVDLECTAFTNDLTIATTLVNYPQVKVILTGGVLDKRELVEVGSISETTLTDVVADKVFLAPMGFSIRRGFTHARLEYASFKKRMVASARQLIGIADSSKFERDYSYVITPIHQLHYLITDQGLPSQAIDSLTQGGVKVVLAEAKGE